MSIVRKDELAEFLGVSTVPTRAQASIDIAEALVSSYLSIHYDRRGSALQEHTVSERITPVRDRTTLEVSGGYVTGIESIAYNVKGFEQTNDEVSDDISSKTPTFEYVFSPEFRGWCVGGKTSSGLDFVFRRGVQYRVTYRTGWCAGNTAYAWEWYRNNSSDTWDDAADRLSWGFVDGTVTTTNAAGAYLLGPQPTSQTEGIHYETGGSVSDERLLSPSLSFDGGDFPFIVTRLNLIEASTTGYACYRVGWLDGDGRTGFTGKKSQRGEQNFLPDRIRASSLNSDHTGYATLVADMGFNQASDMDKQMQDPARSWIDQTITQISLQLWNLGASDPNGALYMLDYVRICDGTARIPESIKMAVLETARAIRDGSSTGIQSESIGDYSKTIAIGEASRVIPAVAKSILDPYRRPCW
jgi:hypothetical protein